MAGDASHARGTAETRQRSFWRDLGRGPLVRGTAHALRDILRAVRLLGRAAVERDALRRSALVEKAAVQLRLIGGETERELRRLQRALSVPATPRLLGERLKGQKVLWLGPCHIEALAEFGREVGCRGEHLLFTSLPHEAPEFSGAGHDAVVVGFNLTYLLLGLPGGGKPSLVHLHPDWTEATAEESLALCKSAIEGFLRHFVEKAEGAPLFVSAILEPSFDYMGVLNKERGPSHFPTFVRRLNEIIRAALRPESNCHFLDINEIVNSVGRFHLTDDIHMFSARASFIADGDVEPDIEAGRLAAPVPPSTTYSMDRRWRMTCEVVWERVLDGIKIIRQIDAVKLIIVDLDDTLWRGVAAEGERDTYFRTVAWPTGFVEALLYFRKRGGLLAICSKNDEAPNARTLRRHLARHDPARRFRVGEDQLAAEVRECRANSRRDQPAARQCRVRGRQSPRSRRGARALPGDPEPRLPALRLAAHRAAGAGNAGRHGDRRIAGAHGTGAGAGRA